MTEAEMEQEIAGLREQVARLEQRQKHWPRLERTSRGMAVAFALAGIALVVAGAIFLDRPNPIFPLALSLILASITLGLLGQALRSALRSPAWPKRNAAPRMSRYARIRATAHLQRKGEWMRGVFW